MKNLPLAVDGELLVLQIQLYVGLAGVELVAAVQGPRIQAGVGGALDVAGLQPAVPVLPLTIGSKSGQKTGGNICRKS